MKKCKIIACKALAHVLETLVDQKTEIRFMDISLHVAPNRLRERLIEEIESIEEDGLDIILGYGLCGRGTEGVFSQKSRLILPRVDDCVGALLGSRDRHRKLLTESPGCYFLEPCWLDTELNIFNELTRGMNHITENKREKIIKLTLSHYKALALLSSDNDDRSAFNQCKEYAVKFGLQLLNLPVNLTLLKKLVNGPYDREQFLMVEPGCPIPFF